MLIRVIVAIFLKNEEQIMIAKKKSGIKNKKETNLKEKYHLKIFPSSVGNHFKLN